MRNLARNGQPVFFRKLVDNEEIVDEYGNPTGSFIPVYGPLQCAMLCVSPNKGSSEINQYGTLLDYDRTMTTSDVGCQIDEDSVLWIDDADTDGAWNAIVKRKSPWKNSISYAIKNVTVSQYKATKSKVVDEDAED